MIAKITIYYFSNGKRARHTFDIPMEGIPKFKSMVNALDNPLYFTIEYPAIKKEIQND